MSLFKKEKISDEKMKKIELVMILVLIIFAISNYIVTTLILKKSTDNIIIWNGEERITQIGGHKIDINKDMTFRLETPDGGYNIIEIKDKKVSCIDANCPDKVCVMHGVLNKEIDNDQIVCAPHKILIQYGKE